MERRVATAIAFAALVGCYTGPNSDLSPALRGPDTTADGTDPSSDSVGPSTPAEGLPCDVAKLLADSCVACHGAPLTGGAPNALLTYDDLVAIGHRSGQERRRGVTRFPSTQPATSRA